MDLKGLLFSAVWLLAVCIPGGRVSAADASLFSLEGLEERINSSEITFSYTYSVSGGKVSMTGRGSAVLQGDAFVLDVDGLQVYCDGDTKWTVDRKAEEVVIESCGDATADLSSNPALLLRSLTGFFEVSSRSIVEYSGMEAIKVELSPKSYPRFRSVTLYFRSGTPDSGILIGASIDASDGTVTDFTVTDFRYGPLQEDTKIFSFDEKSLGSGWIITDLR